jgi:starch-binding outer membrane protein, SusD/RagB family
MKRITIIFPLFLLFFSGCISLDKDVDTNLTKETVFSDERYAAGFLNSAYLEIINGYGRIDNAMFACASDEAICSNSASSVSAFNNGAINQAYNPESNVWQNMYVGIRKTNMFLGELKNTIKAAGLINKDAASMANYKRMKGEAFFLRAYYHFELAKRWGNIQLVDTVLTEETASLVKQSTFTEAIRFIVKDCDSAKVYLQNPLVLKSITVDNYGRATTASAIALKSRALLYLASPWNNPTNDKQLWKEAADVAIAFINTVTASGSSSPIALDPAVFASAMPTISYINTPYSKEVLFATGYDNRNDIEKYNLPISFSGKGYTNPTQELIDCFDPLKGKTIDPTNPYANRDRRFNLYFYYNGQKPLATKTDSVFTYVGGKDGLGRSATATKTGYYMRKFTNFSLDISKGEMSRRAWIHFRFAELLLNYCEAQNEYVGATDNDIISDATIYDQLNKLRTRGGVATYAIGSLTKGTMREAIHKERRVELAFEEHRFWDVRRWKEGTIYFNTTVHGMQITRNSDGKYSYNIIGVENRVYQSKMDWYPIPYTELLKNPQLKQNPNW